MTFDYGGDIVAGSYDDDDYDHHDDDVIVVVKEEGGLINRTSRRRRTLRSRPRCRCTPRRCGGTRWPPRRCRSGPASPGRAAPPPCGGLSLDGDQRRERVRRTLIDMSAHGQICPWQDLVLAVANFPFSVLS